MLPSFQKKKKEIRRKKKRPLQSHSLLRLNRKIVDIVKNRAVIIIFTHCRPVQILSHRSCWPRVVFALAKDAILAIIAIGILQITPITLPGQPGGRLAGFFGATGGVPTGNTKLSGRGIIPISSVILRHIPFYYFSISNSDGISDGTGVFLLLLTSIAGICHIGDDT